MAELSPSNIETKLALSHAGTAERECLAILFAIDDALADVVRGPGPAMLRRIKLAWWRDALIALDTAPAPAEPLLRAVAADLLPRGVTGRELAQLDEPWSVLLQDERLEAGDLTDFANRGVVLFGLCTRLLGGGDEAQLAAAGATWALVDLARHLSDPEEGRAALAAARLQAYARVWSPRLRVLGMLAALAARDAQRDRLPLQRLASPVRIAIMLRVRLLGR